MSTAATTTRFAELQSAVHHACADAYLVEPRVVRRIIRELHGFARLSGRIPHTEVLVAHAADVRQLAHPDELGLTDFTDLSDRPILVAQLEDFELENKATQDILLMLWQRLFHGIIDRELQLQIRGGQLTRGRIEELINHLGQVRFDEAHGVLKAEQRLIHQDSRVEAFCELYALHQQMRRFSPDLLSIWFPTWAYDDQTVDTLSGLTDEDSAFVTSRLVGAAEPSIKSGVACDEQVLIAERAGWQSEGLISPSGRRYARQMRKHDRWLERGNTVSASVAAARAVEFACTPEQSRTAANIASDAVTALANRLHEALQFRKDDLESWRTALAELLQNSLHGFWNSDKRLLYDLQNVCLDHERTTYKVDLVKWIVSRGKRPIRRPLTNLREVMMAKHLARSASRLVYVRLSGADRDRLTTLLHEAADLAEAQMRLRMRSAVQGAIKDVGLQATSVPDQVAFEKMVEESLDCITERGYLTMGYLRDAISRNDLKLPDVSHPKDLILGDHLLRTDDKLDLTLDGVYRRGEFYLRFLQRISSVFFGTSAGRFFTQFVVIPFGGAVVIVGAVEHLLKSITGSKDPGERSAADDEANEGERGKEIDAPAVSDEVLVQRLLSPLPELQNQPVGTPTNNLQHQEVSRLEAFADSGVSPDNPLSVRPISLTGNIEPASEQATGQEFETTAQAKNSDEASNSSGKATPGPTTPPGVMSINTAGGALTENTTANEVSTVDENTAVNEDAPVDENVAAERIDVPPPHPAYQFARDHQSSLIVSVGFLLMALMHLPAFRSLVGEVLLQVWSGIRKLFWDFPAAILTLPVIRKVWKSRWFVWVRRHITTPALIVLLFGWAIPRLFGLQPPNWEVLGAIWFTLSYLLNSRLGRDAEELTAEWVANAWYDLRSRFLMALFDWTIDFFKWLLNSLERFIYAVDEWLRFHSGETWISIVAKAILGVVWSFLSFLIRIYVNLLIEPTLHPVKHFPVVTVAHKIFLPTILVIHEAMNTTLTPYLGRALAEPFIWVTIVFLPGIFGFLVWELKENWRLYDSNRVPSLQPVAIGSHGETGGRLLCPGFHSGTLPKLFHKLRKLETSEASFARFSQRRALREQLHHAERDIRRFVERDLIRLLKHCVAWQEHQPECVHLQASANSFQVELKCPAINDESLMILFQEQSRWIVASVPQAGWLNAAGPEMRSSFEAALRGFYHKAGTDFVREQMEHQFVRNHPYDFNDAGLVIWPDGKFDSPVRVDLYRRHQLRPVPATKAAEFGLQPISREAVVFADNQMLWKDWKAIWATPENAESSRPLPIACLQSASMTLLNHQH